MPCHKESLLLITTVNQNRRLLSKTGKKKPLKRSGFSGLVVEHTGLEEMTTLEKH